MHVCEKCHRTKKTHYFITLKEHSLINAARQKEVKIEASFMKNCVIK